jgi:hypothetical protein
MTEPKKYIKSDDGSMISNPEYVTYRNNRKNSNNAGGGVAPAAGVVGVGSGYRESEIEKQLKEIDGIKHLLTPEEYAAKRAAILG